MRVLSIVPNLPTSDPAALAQFYWQIFDLDVLHDMGWITFLAGPLPAEGPQRPGLQLATEGGAGTDLPALSISVDDLDEILQRLSKAGHEPVYGPVVESWGIRRFFLRDPAGNLVNVATHQVSLEP